MSIFEKALLAADRALNSRSPEEFEREYLQVQNGVGPKLSEFLDGPNQPVISLLSSNNRIVKAETYPMTRVNSRHSRND